MSAGERVRLVYVDATRMVRVIWRGISTDLVALPAAHDNESMRFGVSVATGNTVRVTGASAGAWARTQIQIQIQIQNILVTQVKPATSC
jgi:hypothetical protein